MGRPQGVNDYGFRCSRRLLLIRLFQLTTRCCGGTGRRRRCSGVACGSVAPRLSGVSGAGQNAGWRFAQTPRLRLLPQRTFDLAFASLVANTTCWGLLKQPYKQEETRYCSPNTIAAERLLFVGGDDAELRHRLRLIAGSEWSRSRFCGLSANSCSGGRCPAG